MKLNDIEFILKRLKLYKPDPKSHLFEILVYKSYTRRNKVIITTQLLLFNIFKSFLQRIPNKTWHGLTQILLNLCIDSEVIFDYFTKIYIFHFFKYSFEKLFCTLSP